MRTLNYYLYLVTIILIVTGMVFAETNGFAKTPMEEIVPKEITANQKAEEAMNLKAWHDLLLDLSKNLGKENQRVEEFNFMRPIHCLNMYYSVLGTITDKDVE